MKFYRKIFIWQFIFSFLFINIALAASPEITAESAIVVEAGTGRVVYEKNADAKRYPASLTKMMTAILAKENLASNDVITISEAAAYVESSTLGLMPGDKISAKELITGMLLASDNGAALALAEAVDGDEALFADRMNEKALEFGMLSTHFVTPNGLHDDEHYSTARDMAKLARELAKDKFLTKVTGTKKQNIKWLSPKGKNIDAMNTNELLEMYPYAVGMKTGYTSLAGGCLAAKAKKNGVTLIAIILKSADYNSRFSEAKELLEYSFKRVSMVEGLAKERVNETVYVAGGVKYKLRATLSEDIYYPLIDGESAEKYSLKLNLPKIIEAPIEKGDEIGSMDVYYGDEMVESVPIVARDEVTAGFSFLSWLVGLVAPLVD